MREGGNHFDRAAPPSSRVKCSRLTAISSTAMAMAPKPMAPLAHDVSDGGSTWRDKRGEMGDFRAAWRRCHGLPVGSEPTGLFSRVWRAGPRLQMHPEELVVASHGAATRAL